MFGLDPLSRPVAIAEILLLLTAAALVGWLLGRLTRRGRVNALRHALANRQGDNQPFHRPTTTTITDEIPVPLIVADPLAPVYGMPTLTIPDTDEEPEQPTLPTTPPPIEIPPLGAPIPEAPPRFLSLLPAITQKRRC
ncbi:hypothetical protein [Spirosoma rhododendri]|uniref:hypothetical protein n=1 Tax=Spirosoma rhododendri TaxID=2728024 RepID=UPI0020C4F9D1|nr:hypothetical protein [Spirosoma rhododendri]